MALKNLSLLPVYSSDDNDLLKEFFVPALSEAVRYDRGVGYFSSGMLSVAGKGVSALIENGGTMRLIFNGQLSAEDFAAVQEGYHARAVLERIGEEFVQQVDDLQNYIAHYRLKALSWLIAAGKLEMKVALRPKGMYHDKVGVIYDASGDFIVFQGSANETAAALAADINYESFNVYCSWRPDDQRHIEPHRAKFERLWRGESKKTLVLPFPEAARERLVQVARAERMPRSSVEVALVDEALAKSEAVKAGDTPSIPQVLGGDEYALRKHQLEALYAWKNRGFRGIFKLATGAGKTITAIHGAIRLFEHTKKLFVVIAVPYQSLADQWIDVLGLFNVSAIPCYASKERWHQDLNECASAFGLGASRFACAVVVNRTLESSAFQSIIARVPSESFLFIGDECHHHASGALSKSLPNNASMRLGLSATPESGDVIPQALANYYGEVVSEYGLADALRDGVLTPYRYHVKPVYLDGEEVEGYLKLSREISAEFARSGDRDNESWSPRLKALMGKRARLIAHCRGKLVELRKLLESAQPKKHTLFYCGEGFVEGESDEVGEELRHTEEVASTLNELGWRLSRFTSIESRSERKRILADFADGQVDGLVAIRCLDEGIDVPACSAAYFLASSRNPRQFIQRRGRILRRSPGKEIADIYDFLVLLPPGLNSTYEIERKLLAAELKRYSEFAGLAANWVDAHKAVEAIASDYELEHLL